MQYKWLCAEHPNASATGLSVYMVRKLSRLNPLSTTELVPAAVLDYTRTSSRSTNGIFSRKDKWAAVKLSAPQWWPSSAEMLSDGASWSSSLERHQCFAFARCFLLWMHLQRLSFLSDEWQSDPAYLNLNWAAKQACIWPNNKARPSYIPLITTCFKWHCYIYNKPLKDQSDNLENVWVFFFLCLHFAKSAAAETLLSLAISLGALLI